jgi:fumarate reductase subunit D
MGRMGSVKIITIYVAMLVVAMALVFGAIALFDYGLDNIAFREWLLLIVLLIAVILILHLWYGARRK